LNISGKAKGDFEIRSEDTTYIKFLQYYVLAISRDFVLRYYCIKLKPSGDIEGQIEINKKILHASSFSKGYICDISNTAKGIKSKLSGNVQMDVILNVKSLCVSMLLKRPICSVSGTAKGIKFILSGNLEGHVELNIKTLCAYRLSEG
jgi:hypothetical protein